VDSTIAAGMKTALLLTLIAFPAFADVELERDQAATMKSFTLNELVPQVHDFVGKIIKVKFSSRDATIRKEKDFSVGLIYNYTNTRKRGVYTYFASARIHVPEEGLSWFSKLTVGDLQRSSYVVVCRVEKGGTMPELKALGREIKTDSKGSRVIW
jgi:hypothetical protein